MSHTQKNDKNTNGQKNERISFTERICACCYVVISNDKQLPDVRTYVRTTQ